MKGQREVTYLTGEIDVIGPIWWPAGAMAATTYNVHGQDIENMRDESGKLTRESLALWVDSHAGDFQSVTDFTATIDGEVFGWADDDSAMVWAECMWPDESDEVTA